jgi:hypothetical protein
MNINDPVPPNGAGDGRRSAQKLHFYNVRLSERSAWFGVTVAALFNVLGMLLEIGITREAPGVSARPAVVSALVGLVLLIVLFIRRKTPSVKWGNVVYLINTAAVATTLLSTNLAFARSEENWVPFQADKLGCLIAAMLAPGFWVGLLSILAHSVGPLLQFEFFFPPELKALAKPEPWPLLAFGLAGALALVYRFRRTQLEQEIARIQAQNLVLKGMAQAFLNIRDLMNTPLQVIELSVGLLRKSNGASEPSLDRIDRSVQSLRDINSVLVLREKEIEEETKR